nr:putative retrotransposon protein [Tanacetum cinerariifolium]
MTTTVVNNSVFRAFFEKQRLTRPNFIDWYRNLQIVLLVEDKLPYLEQPIPAMPIPPAGQVLPPDVLNTHTAWVKASKEIADHELLQTVREFHASKQEEGQSEVENQLEKIIKSLRFDRKGEYMSQEFLDHLKEHGIIAHRTLLYTPQHNGVSDRRNRTLLDMVCSMMSQTTLPKSFWDYALESAAHILNMVPTKKVEKITYEMWHGQATKLSYLKV